MNEIYSTHKSINIKKILIIICVSVFLMIFCILLLSNNPDEQANIVLEEIHTFTDDTNYIQLKLSSNYGLNKIESDENHILELRSKNNNLEIFLSSKHINIEDSLSNLILSEKEKYIANYENVSNLSEIMYEKINNIDFYSYSFNFNNNSCSYAFDSIWFSDNSGIYIIDILFPVDKIDAYVSIHSDIINSLSILNAQN